MSDVATKSGTGTRGRRSGLDRLDAIPAAVARRDEFLSRVKDAEGDTIRLSDLMAEAISMDRKARGLEPVNRDGRTTFSMERLAACHCMDAAKDAYLKARGSNQPPRLADGQSAS